VFTASTYTSDRALFRRLGLTPFKDVPSQTTLELGRVSVGDDGSYVDITVTCMPAQFWRFTIYRASSKDTLTLNTGSGGLNEYWPTAKLFAEGMLSVALKR
jgi:hypothetical protein